jgi:hypothetical protein
MNFQHLYFLEKVDDLLENRNHHEESLSAIDRFVIQMINTIPVADDAFQHQLEDTAIDRLRQSNLQRSKQRAPITRHRNYQSVLSVRKAIIIVSMVLLTLGLFASIPAARAAIGDMLQRFGLVLTNQASIEDSSSLQRSFDAVPLVVEQDVPLVSFATAQQQVPFTIPLPSWLPKDLELVGARVGEGPSSEEIEAPLAVVLSFQRKNATELYSSAGMFIQLYASELSGGYEIPSLESRNVLVNNQVAIYAEGAWTPDHQWNDEADVLILSWEDGRFTYVLSASGLGINIDQAVRIAESIRNDP